MSEPFLSEIKIVSFPNPPKGWAFCNGQTLPIAQNQALFSLLGTTYGGNGQTTYGLPNLQGQVPIHMGNGHTLGEKGGASSVTVDINTMPTHIHALQGLNNPSTVASNTAVPTGAFFAAVVAPIYAPTSAGINTSAAPSAVTTVGGSQPHNNLMPYLVLNFIIALQGIFPSQT